MKGFDLMFGVNVRGTYACSRACLPYLLESDNPHVLMLSPPLNMNARWFKDHLAYTMAKYGMSMCVLGLAEEFREAGLAVNALWPRTVIHTAAIAMLGSAVNPENCRTEEVVAEAAYTILVMDSRSCTGNFFIDEDLLKQTGVQDFERFAVKRGAPLLSDVFLD
jgi:citronellol/citronellal dehydrogenase